MGRSNVRDFHDPIFLTYAYPEKAGESQKDIAIPREEDGSAACEPHWRLEKIDESLLHLPTGRGDRGRITNF